MSKNWNKQATVEKQLCEVFVRLHVSTPLGFVLKEVHIPHCANKTTFLTEIFTITVYHPN